MGEKTKERCCATGLAQASHSTKKLIVSSEQREVMDLLTQLSETAMACAHESDRRTQIPLATRETLTKPAMEAPPSQPMQCSGESDMVTTTYGGTEAYREQEQAAQSPELVGCADTSVPNPQSDDETAKEPMQANSSQSPKNVTTLNLLKGAASIACTMAVLLAMIYFPAAVCCPWSLPAGHWSHNSTEILENAGQFVLLLSLWGSIFASVILFLCAWAETRARERTNIPEELTIPLGKDMAFELCMAATRNIKILRANEESGEIVLQLTPVIQLSLCIEPAADGGSKVNFATNYRSRCPRLFWGEHMDTLMSLLPDEVVRTKTNAIQQYIKDHHSSHGQREPLSEYRTRVNYSAPIRKERTALFSIGLCTVFPLLLWSFGQFTPKGILQRARYESTANAQESLKLYKQVIAMEPQNANLLAERGDVYMQLNQPRNAEFDFRKAISIGGHTQLSTIYRLQFSLVQQGRLDEVLLIDKAIATDFGDTPLTLNNRGWHQAITGNPEECVVDANKAITLDPTFYSAYGTRGYAYHLLGDEQHAIADYTTALSLNPNDRVARFLRAQALRNIGDIAQGNLDEAQARQEGMAWYEVCVPPTFSSQGDPPPAPQWFTPPLVEQ